MFKITALIFVFQKQPFSLRYRLSQSSHSIKRYFSTKSDDSDNENSKDNLSLHKKEVQSSIKDPKTSPEKKALSKEETKQEAKKKLLSLLSEMTIVPNSKTKAGENLKLARPVKRISKQERFKEEIEKHKEMEKSPEDKLQDAAKVVASSVKGDAQQTLAELNEKLRKLNLAFSPPLSLEAESEKILDEETNKNFMSSGKEITATVVDDSAPRSKLAERLLKISMEQKSSGFKRPLDELVKGMKIEKQAPEARRREFESKDVRRRELRPSISPEDKLQDAAKVGASSVKGDAQETLAELNEKLRKLNLAFSPPLSLEAESEKILDEETNKNFMSSVKEIAATVVDDSAPRSKLAKRLLKISMEEKSSGFKRPLDELVKGMKIEKQAPEARRREFESKDVRRRELRPSMVPKARINILDAAPLNIFRVTEEPNIDTEKTVWQILEEKNLKLLSQFAPANGFEEMIMWTEQGKHWKFPIDNQTELAGEENVGFHEHVFLEQHLHGFPTKGPIRHFMELVIVGLSKNPYVSVERKIENIDWFREYFKEKEDILKATGALG